MRRTGFPFAPQPGELGEERLQTFSLRTMTGIARAIDPQVDMTLCGNGSSEALKKL
jgi:hypothetical protein